MKSLNPQFLDVQTLGQQKDARRYKYIQNGEHVGTLCKLVSVISERTYLPNHLKLTLGKKKLPMHRDKF